MVVYGGATSIAGEEQLSEQIWVWNLKSDFWTKMDCRGEGPGPRADHAVVMWGHRMVMYGGRTPYGECPGDVWMLNLVNFQWERAGRSTESRLAKGAIHPTMCIQKDGIKEAVRVRKRQKDIEGRAWSDTEGWLLKKGKDSIARTGSENNRASLHRKHKIAVYSNLGQHIMEWWCKFKRGLKCAREVSSPFLTDPLRHARALVR
eukprot:gene20201-1049_t